MQNVEFRVQNEPLPKTGMEWFPNSAFIILHSSFESRGSPRCCPVLCGLRNRCIAAMLATQARREGGVEPPQPGL